ncbi:MAG: protein kinase, partial [Anaerolineae bacterium]
MTQNELARRVGCAPITIRKIEYDALRPSVQMAELLALALNIPEEEQLGFVRLARQKERTTPIPTPAPMPGEIGMANLSGRSVKAFQLGERIGSGGFGVVYRAWQPSVNRDVAVKIILPRFANNPNFIRRFEAEAQLVARLEHPHIVPLYDYWREPDAAYLIMRLLRGGSLEDQLASGPLSLAEVQQTTQQIGLALDVAHRHDIIHRDIKPANVLLDEDKNAYLVDFGIAKNLDRMNGKSLTEGGVVIGSPAYISPEQILAEPVGPQSDIYCLGILLFEVLTGQKPFPGPTPVAYIQQHLNDPLPSLSQFNGDLPPALDDVIRRATAKKIEDRYPTTPAFLDDFEKAVETAVSPTDHHPVPAADTTVPPITTQEIAALENPYCGLRAFTAADAANFYGRDALVQEMLGMMSDSSDLSRFTAVVGPSGSGKSSVVKAGLMPSLRRGGLPNSDDWFMVDLTPGTHPWEEAEAALLRIAINPPDSLLPMLQEGHRGLLRAVRRVLPEEDGSQLVLVIDQFEELFTLVKEEEIRAHFLASLVTAVLDPHSRLQVVITLRADFTDRPLQYVDFGELMRQRTLFVLPLTPDELNQAITQPVAKLGMTMQPDLIATIIREVEDQPGMLP